MTRLNPLPLLLLPLAFNLANAQQDDLVPTEEQEEVRRYTVEMIIFTYNENVSVGSEVFVPDAPPPEDEALDEFALNPELPGDGKPLMEVELQVRGMYELVMLPEDDFTMNEIYGHLERLDVYEPILHFGWTQPTYPQEDSPARPLSSFVTPPANLGLEGDLQLYLGRYLHLAIDLQLDGPAERTAATDYEYDGYRGSNTEGGRFDEYGVAIDRPVHYRIQEDRIFRSGETRYFDHPKFGVLAKITRWEEPESEELNEEFLGDTELLGLDGE